VVLSSRSRAKSSWSRPQPNLVGSKRTDSIYRQPKPAPI